MVMTATLRAMRHRSAIVSTVCGAFLLFGSLSIVLAQDTPETELSYRAFVPALSGDSASGSGELATSTPSPTPSPTPTPIGFGCAGPRSAIRTLTDNAAGFSRTPGEMTIPLLNGLAKPGTVPGLTRLSPLETGVVKVTAFIKSSALDSRGNTVAQIANTAGDFTISAGFPSQNCTTAAADADRGAMNAARVSLVSQCGQPGAIANLGGKVEVTGVPHWTVSNGEPVISIWPVLEFEVAEGWDCQGQAPTPTPTGTPVPDIDVLILTVLPQNLSVGETTELIASPQPLGPGRVCVPTSFRDGANNPWPLAGVEEKTTGPSGIVSWFITIPEGFAPGSSRFQVRCTDATGPGSNGVNFEVS